MECGEPATSSDSQMGRDDPGSVTARLFVWCGKRSSRGLYLDLRETVNLFT